VAVVCLALYAALHAIVAGADPWGWELDLVEAATRLPGPVGWPLRAVMNTATRPYLPAFAAVAYLLQRRWAAPIAVVVAGYIATDATGTLKDWASRERPDGVRLRDHVGGFGFPSGHTTCAFAVAAVVATQLPPRWRPLAYGLAAAAGIARMHVGVHHPLDVVGGALWGTVVAYLVVAVTSLDVVGQNARHG
jgi:membrane-associated phospholipid phosphatase